MADKQYTYAVARIRTKEMALFGKTVIDQLLACKSYGECRQLLADKGWGKNDGETMEQLLAEEREKTWTLIAELVKDMSAFDTFLYENDYHNLKAAIKQVYTGLDTPGIYISHGTVEPAVIYEAVKQHDFERLPESMRASAEEAYQVQMHTGDSQLCDVILDKAALTAMLTQSKASGNELLQQYAELRAAQANIQIALRGMKTGKTEEFFKRALAPCGSLDIDALMHSALEGQEAIFATLSTTAYADAVPAIRQSASAFEKWCDDFIMDKIRPQKYNPFTLSPLAAYILARQNEIKTVRILLSGKLNDLPEESIRQRLRDMYV